MLGVQVFDMCTSTSTVLSYDLQKANAGISASKTVKSLGKAQTTERGRRENVAEGRGGEITSREGEER